MAPTISRRHIMILAGAGAAAAALPTALILVEPDHANLADELMFALADPSGAAEIGRRWMEETGHEHNGAALAQKIAKRLRAHGWRPGDEPGRMRAALASRIRQEFEHDTLVDVSGWQITRTSAELCALAATRSEQAPAEAGHSTNG